MAGNLLISPKMRTMINARALKMKNIGQSKTLKNVFDWLMFFILVRGALIIVLIRLIKTAGERFWLVLPQDKKPLESGFLSEVGALDQSISGVI